MKLYSQQGEVTIGEEFGRVGKTRWEVIAAIEVPTDRQRKWVTMKIEHTKEAKYRPSAGVSCTASAHLVPVQGLRAQGNRSLPTPGLCQPRSLPELQASYRSTTPLQVLSHRTSLVKGILSLLSQSNARQQPHFYWRSVSNTSSIST